MRVRVVVTGLSLALGAMHVPAAGHGASIRPPPEMPRLFDPGANRGNPARPTTNNPGRPNPGITGGPGTLLRPSRGRTGFASELAATTDRWEFWWRHNLEPYLPRHRGDGAQTISGVGGFLLGRGGPLSTTPGRFLPGEVRVTILPVLASVLRDRSPDVVDSALIAMARSAEASEAGPFLPMFERSLSHEQRPVREAAILALGILGAPRGVELLQSMVIDGKQGRKALDEPASIDDKDRALAALALGLSEDPGNVALLLEVVRSPSSSRQLASCAVLALGLQANQASEIAIEFGRMLASTRLDREVRAQVPVALQRLPRGVARSQLTILVELLSAREAPPSLRRSIAIALGQLGSVEDAVVIEALVRAMRKDDDVMARNFCCIALGRMGERAEWSVVAEEATRDFYEEVTDTLAREMAMGKNQLVQPFAALGLALCLRGEAFGADDDELAALRRGKLSKLRENFTGERDPSLQGGGAIALGLSGAVEHAEVLRGRLGKTKNPTLQGHLAVALGMLDDRDSVPRLRALLDKRGITEELRVEVTRALGMMQDSELQEFLIRRLQEANSIPEAAALAKGLGLSGDRTAAPPLLEIVPDTKEQNLRRAFAIVALGLLAEKTALPWNVRYSVDANYTLALEPLRELIQIL